VAAVSPSRLLVEDDAVSSVIGVVLMVAVTIVLVAAVGVFVLGIGTGLTQSTPTASFGMEWDLGDSGSETVAITLTGSSRPIPARTLNVSVDGRPAWDGTDGPQNDFAVDGTPWQGDVESGDTLTLNESGNGGLIDRGDVVLVVWEDGDTSTVLFTDTVG
jgi:flagellin-like protein